MVLNVRALTELTGILRAPIADLIFRMRSVTCIVMLSPLERTTLASPLVLAKDSVEMSEHLRVSLLANNVLPEMFSVIASALIMDPSFKDADTRVVTGSSLLMAELEISATKRMTI